MDFEAYFQATEEAFAEEKQDMLMKIEKLHEKWKEASELDQKIIDKSKELIGLKRLISKGHLQILRTKEECLHMLLKNSQLSFHVRQLQSEIFRLIPYSHTEVPSTEYHMSLDRSVFAAPAHQNKSEADEEHMKDIKHIHKLWTELCDRQQEVFAEETLHYQEDAEQWGKFETSVKDQNENQHRNLDRALADLLQRYLSLKGSNEEMVKSGEERAENLLKKLNRLKKKVETTMAKMNKKKEEDKNKAQREANKLTKELRRRVAFIEGSNQVSIEQSQEDNALLLDKEDDLLDDIDELNAKIKKYEEKNKGLSEEGERRLKDLDAQLQALVTAASAIKDASSDEHLNIIGAVSSAVGLHGKTATKVERIQQKLANLNKQLENETLNFDFPK